MTQWPGFTLPATAVILGFMSAAPAHWAAAGGAAGVATEWTQLLNNAELAHLSSLEASHLSVASETLSTEVEQLRNLILAYRNMEQNTEKLPGSFHRKAAGSILDLRRMYLEAGSLAGSGRELDAFLRSGLIEDPRFEASAYEETDYQERYADWQDRWTSTLSSSLQQAGLTLDDVETEAALIDRMAERADQADGNLQALEVANELSGSLARQMLDLRALQAAQAERTAIAWARILDEKDVQRAMDRRHLETLETDRARVSEGTGIHQLLGLDQ